MNNEKKTIMKKNEEKNQQLLEHFGVKQIKSKSQNFYDTWVTWLHKQFFLLPLTHNEQGN